jgi:hypothetical protein
MSQATRIVVVLLVIILTVGFLLPTGIAIIQNHPKVVSIVLWNTVGMLLLGLGWLVALVIALTDGGAQQQSISQQQTIVIHTGTSSRD